MQKHSKYAERDFFAVGESYAGHYIPAVTHEVWKNNNNLPAGAIKIKLTGTAVGNGLTDPAIQYKYYKDMIVSTNNHKAAVGSAVHAAMEAATPVCEAAIAACDTVQTTCIAAIEACNMGLLIPYTLTGMNPYDMRIKCAKPPLCYDFSNVGTYLDRPEVRATLGVGERKWSDCNHLVAIAFELGGDWMQPYQQMIPDQLESGIRCAATPDLLCLCLCGALSRKIVLAFTYVARHMKIPFIVSALSETYASAAHNSQFHITSVETTDRVCSLCLFASGCSSTLAIKITFATGSETKHGPRRSHGHTKATSTRPVRPTGPARGVQHRWEPFNSPTALHSSVCSTLGTW